MERLPTSNRGFNRQSVQAAIKSAQQRLKLFNHPENGLVVYCGLAQVDGEKEKMISVHFEPPRAMPYLYRCDDCFYVESLRKVVDDDCGDSYGFIVIDGNGALFGKLQGVNREVLRSFSVDLPNKHRRGGQSALRFERIRKEKRHIYLCKVAEGAARLFIGTDNLPAVKGLILAGSGDLKCDLLKNSQFDKRLRGIVIKSVDISHGGHRGFDEAVGLSLDSIGSVELLRQRELLEQFMAEVEQDRGHYCFMAEDTMWALEIGAVKHLIVYENLDTIRSEMRDPQTGSVSVVYGGPGMKTNNELEVVKEELFTTWICDNYTRYGCNIEFVSDHFGEGRQFVMGFGGIAGILRWKVDFNIFDEENKSKLCLFDENGNNNQSESNTGYEFDFGDEEFEF